MASPTLRTRAIAEKDRARWRELYGGYVAFYAIEFTDEQADTLWAWLMEPEHEVEGLVVVDSDDVVVGLAHFRAFASPSTTTTRGRLDDLFVEPASRGQGAVDALLCELRAIARRRGWRLVRWITAESNYRAQAVYDRHAARTRWVTYDMAPAASE